MSRIGRQWITIPEGVDVETTGFCWQTVCVKGPRGELFFTLPPFLTLVEDFSLSPKGKGVGRTIYIQMKQSPKFNKVHNELYGLSRTALSNMIKGVAEGFQKRLRLTGVGYRAAIEDGCLILNVGYSQVVKVAVPADISLQCETPTSLLISGIKKDQVGNFASKIRLIRAPEPYKGKGISYENEFIRRKPGKTGK